MIRLLYIVAQPVRWVAFEWIAGTLDPKRFRLSFLLLSEGPPALGPYLDELEIPWLHLAIRHRSQVPWLARRIAEQCRKERIQIVHAHFMNSCLAGLTGAFLAGVKCRLHTRHHAGPFPSSHRPWWGKFYDQYNNRLSTRIVVPSRLVENVLVHRERVSLAKLVRIYHGFDLGSFSDVPEIAVELMREKYELGNRWPVVGVVARYEEIKGVHFIIEAFHALLIEQPGACLVLANARGKTMPRIREQLARLPPDSYREILFEENMPPLYALFDLFVHVPLAAGCEAFGQVYVEAWAAGIPSIVTPAGIAAEFAIHERNAYVVGFGESADILAGMKALLAAPRLREGIAEGGRRLARERFSLSGMVQALEHLYQSENERAPATCL